MKNTIPPIGTEILCSAQDITISRDGRTPVCRIKFDEHDQTWAMVPTEVTRGLLVFLTRPFLKQHNRIRITMIQPTGRGAYADPVTH
jgi:hypothetical protein